MYLRTGDEEEHNFSVHNQLSWLNVRVHHILHRQFSRASSFIVKRSETKKDFLKCSFVLNRQPFVCFIIFHIFSLMEVSRESCIQTHFVQLNRTKEAILVRCAWEHKRIAQSVTGWVSEHWTVAFGRWLYTFSGKCSAIWYRTIWMDANTCTLHSVYDQTGKKCGPTALRTHITPERRMMQSNSIFFRTKT